MPIEKRKDGLYLRFKDIGGRWRYSKTTATTQDEAKSLLRGVERGIERQRLGLEPIDRNPLGWTVADLMGWWLRTYSKASPAHDRNTGTVTNQILGDDIAGLRLEHVSTGLVEEHIQAKVNAGLQAESVNHIRGFLSRAFEAAKGAGKWHGENPVDKVKKRKVPTQVRDTLSTTEAHLVLSAANPKHRAILAVGIYAALRKGEVIALRKQDVNLAKGTITVAQSGLTLTTKGGHGDVIPMHDELRPFLEEALKAPGPLVFPNDEGEQRNASGFAPEDMLRRAMKKAGLIASYTLTCRRDGCGYSRAAETAEDARCPTCNMKLWPKAHPRPLRFHDLRHTAATLMLEAGADLHAVQKIMRHKSPTTTMRVYGHVQQQYIRAQMAKLKVAPAPEPGRDQVLATPLLLTPKTAPDAGSDPDDGQEKTPDYSGVFRELTGGADGTRTRGLRRDRPAL